MKKHLFLLTLLSISLMMWAEAIPTDYYKACNGKKDAALKTALSETVKGGVRYLYGTNDYHTTNGIASKDTIINGISYHKGDTIWRKGDVKYGTWQAFPVSDIREDGSIWDMYSNNHRFYPFTRGNSAANIQIEHCFPKSWWNRTNNDAYKDLFHLNPADGSANGSKGNNPPGFVEKDEKKFSNVFKSGKMNVNGKDIAVFEIADCYKGDFARAYFYIATAYEDYNWYESTCGEYMDNSSYLEFRPWLIDVLLTWHRLDPVSKKEVNRIDQISSIQHNRNPYIDYPELVEYIWGNKKGEVVDFSKLACTQDPSYPLAADSMANFYANPATDIYKDAFVVSWNNFFEGPYYIDVYSDIIIKGQNDTILAIPETSMSVLQNFNQGGVSCSISDAVQAEGTASVQMAKAGKDGEITLSGISLAKNAVLSFRASSFRSDVVAQLKIFLNGHNSPDTIISDIRRDEMYYTYCLPKNTTSIKLMSVGASLKTPARVILHSLFILTGDRQELVSYKKGYPIEIDANVSKTMLHITDGKEGENLYYRVRTAGGWVSNEVPVTLGTEEKVYHLEVVVAPGAKGTASGSGDYAYNEEVTISATADSGHHFTMWSDGNKDNPRKIKVTEDMLLEAYFAEDGAKQALVMVNYTQGQLKINNENVASGEVKSFDVGTTITLKAGTVTGYKFDGWSDGFKKMTYELTLTQDTVLSYTYTINQYEIKTAVEGDKGGVVIGAGKYDYGTEVELTAVPDDGYQFVEWKWMENKTEKKGKDNPIIVTVTNSSSQVYTAVFEVVSALNHVSTTAMPKKMYINGHLYVLRDGQIFSVLGQLVHE
ncbi:MAG: endonuclease [Bacteroidales bacterium]|nr:endonuclease [Candidatus Colicola caccequi]